MKHVKVSVIIPTFNEEKNISACINSMLSQSEKNVEILIVDDGSTDQTSLILDELQRNNSELRLLKQHHQGPAKARNLAAKQALGEILVFMDADMTFDKNFIKELISPIIRNETKGTFSKEELVGNWENVWSRCWNYNQNLPAQKMIPEDYPDQGLDFRAVLKSEFLKVGGFDDTGYTDTWSLWKKLGYKPQAVKGAKYFHNNPDNLNEVFIQAKWVAKRKYKLGLIGDLAALARAFFFVSLVIGVFKSLRYQQPAFLIFKIVYDLGSFWGIIEMILTGKLAK
jgi:glycosyltransferase involved in cell wall biosynthesis